MTSDDNSSSSSDDDERFLPKSRKGWQGEDLELEHARESSGKSKQAAAVDISQFQNTEVGKGYQAKHVVRQQHAERKTVEIIDYSQKNKKRAREEEAVDDDQKKEVDNPKTRLKKYLASPGFVMFRKEIEDILSS